MALSKPSLKRLKDWANSLTQCCICKKYHWLLNTESHYKNQHPNENVPEVSAAIVQTLQKKLIKDQTYKKRKAKRKKRKV